jgi:antirestriction protein ArdC
MNKAIYESITNNIVEALEQAIASDGVSPWNQAFMPHNHTTRRPYKKGYSNPSWLTLKQANNIGASVLKGESGTRCLFYNVIKDEDDNIVSGHASWFTVFNVAQLSDFEDIELLPVNTVSDVLAHPLYSLAKHYCSLEGIQFNGWFKDVTPSYNWRTDTITMPDNGFKSNEDYLATLAHEIVHSTGSVKRLDRGFMVPVESRLVQNDEYAFEELVAELGSVFICSDFGIRSDFNDHVGYLESWFAAINKEPKFLFKAISAASMAAYYFLDCEQSLIQDEVAI